MNLQRIIYGICTFVGLCFSSFIVALICLWIVMVGKTSYLEGVVSNYEKNGKIIGSLFEKVTWLEEQVLEIKGLEKR